MRILLITYSPLSCPVFGYFSLLGMILNDGSDVPHTVCLGFSHEFTQFCQSWFYLQNQVKKVSRITYFAASITFFWVRSCFWPVCIHLPWSCDPVWSPDQKAKCLPEPKGRSWQRKQGNPGRWNHQKYQVCGRFKYFSDRLKLGS